ncbi:hypothetical protein ACHAXA_005386, partial [Cyclostephanos tholiformis]
WGTNEMNGRPPPAPVAPLPRPPPPPPPPPPTTMTTTTTTTTTTLLSDSPVVVTDNSDGGNGGNGHPTATTTTIRTTPIPPPSVLRDSSIGSRHQGNTTSRNSGNNVAFVEGVDVMDSSRDSKSTTSSAVGMGVVVQRPRPSPITLNRVVSSQFENEAETHIIAALEMEDERNNAGGIGGGAGGMRGGRGGGGGGRGHWNDGDMDNTGSMGGSSRGLLGEGIVGIEDYSDDDEYDQGGCGDDERGGRQRQRQRQQQRQQQQTTTTKTTANRDRTLSNDSFLRKVAAMQNELPQYQTRPEDDCDASTGYSSSPRADSPGVLLSFSSSPTSDGGEGGVLTTHGNDDDDDGAHGVVEKRTAEDGTTGHGHGVERNIMTDATETTGNMNMMADRLRSLQTRRASLTRGGGGGSVSTSISGGDGGGGVDDPESSGDRLIAALNSVDSSKNGSFWAKIYSEYNDLIVPKLPQFQRELSIVLFYVVVPFLAVASLLFYMLDNPMAGDTGTSISWWILFVGVRQPIIFEFTRVGEVFWVEILALRSKLFNRAVGPYVSLAFIQSSGWPYIVCFWAVLNFAFLYGNLQFHKHWLFWQEQLDLFNSNNPAGVVTEAETYFKFLLSCIFVGAVVSFKRLFLAIYLGRREVTHFSGELELLMAKMILIGEVANLARNIENKRVLFASNPQFDPIGESEKLVQFQQFMSHDEMEAKAAPAKTESKDTEVPTMSQSNLVNDDQGESTTHTSPPRPISGRIPRSVSDAAGDRTGFDRGDTSSNVELLKLLSEWEEPELTAQMKNKATVRDLVIFKKTVNCMDDKYPFGHAFGHAKTREACVQSAQEVYDRLMISVAAPPSNRFSRFDDDSEPVLPFSIVSVLATNANGDLVDAKIKSLIRLFRPDRNGDLSRLDFVRSIDTVYKQLRLLRASIGNSAQIDLAFEKIVNCFFYFFLSVCAVSILGIDLWTNFIIPLNAFFLGLSFLFGAAASNYFEGLLLIFVRRPYDIGDRIATSDPSNETDPNGSSTWYVDKVTLFSTTVRLAATNEVATYSNGSLAVLRIINANRSPKACISIAIKFGLETLFGKIVVFREAVEKFIKARPREWISLVAFRAARVEADFGYVEYKIVAQHRERWQNIGLILQSKADLSSFCLEVTKKLDMKYESPPMPVNLSENIGLRRILGEQSGGGIDDDVQAREEQRILSVDDLQDVADMFQIRSE